MTKKTVYIVGAGASYEANLPTGDELKDQIANLLNIRFEFYQQKSGDYKISSALKNYALTQQSPNSFSDYITECQHISSNMPLAISIDNFIDTKKDNVRLALCGKLAIVESILKAEKNSLLYFDPFKGGSNINFPSLNGTWYLLFFRTLTENCNVEELPARFKNITLIIFNYDRCIEHFLLHALMSYYRLSETDAGNLIDNINIIHPYGTVGSLNWQDKTSSTSIEFGGELNTSQLINYAQRIRTFTEGAHSEQMPDLQDSMLNTNRLVFLGFAFHRLNMELIANQEIKGYQNKKTINCYATAYGTSKSDQQSIINSINYLYKENININIENTTCSKIFDDYSRSLGYE